MILPAQLAWIALIAFLLLLLVMLLEIHRNNYRREHEVMFGTRAFNEGTKAYQFTPKEIRTLEKIVRSSKFENKDAVINSAELFEAAVSNFYDYRNVMSVRDETLEAITSLREKMDFTASNPLAGVTSTRQFNKGNRIDLLLDDGSKIKHSEILWRTEKEIGISYDNSMGSGRDLVGDDVGLRWTRPEDAVYTTTVKATRYSSGELVVSHSSVLEKQQLRRWVREVVNFPMEAFFADGTSCEGLLIDLSAGGILLGLPKDCAPGDHVRIKFELPSFGPEDVEVEILRSLGHKNPDHPELFSQTASFTGAFGWTQERVLQYIFEVHKAKKEAEKALKMS